MSPTVGSQGSRLLVALLQQLARTDPSRPWASIPIDEADLPKGFRDISYAALLNATYHATHWLNANLDLDAPFECVAYIGPKDIRYPILAIAIANVRAKLLLPSPFASSTAFAHLIRSSNCRVLLHAEPMNTAAEQAVATVANGVRALQVPSLSAWLSEEQADAVLWTKSWDEAKLDPWLIFHTSGTSGFPKLITYTHEMMTSLDAANTQEPPTGDTQNRHFGHGRWFTPLPTLHFVGMTVALQFTAFLGAVLVVGPATPGPLPPALAADVLRYGEVRGSVMPPSLIDGICNVPEGLDTLRRMDYLYFAGAPLSISTANRLLGHNVKVKPAMGSTEAGGYFMGADSKDDWQWYRFRDLMGFEFRPVSGALHEAIFVRDPKLERFQQIFKIFPDLQEFPTKDMFVENPARPGTWKYTGRTDDLIIFSHGEDLFASEVEKAIAKHPKVLGVLVGGTNRPRPWLLIQWATEEPETDRLEQLWPVVEEANKSSSDLVKLSKELTLFTKPSKGLVRTAKGDASRPGNEELYKDEIAALYAD